ncbi:MAG TPA: cyclase family protein [Bacteroidota bacterium]|nr:cyclase family protein [Bacteroidota bacterium]
MPKQFIDLSHAVEHGMITYKGLPGPVISDYLSRADSRSRYTEGTEFQIGKIEMVANTGTYIDSPFHRFANAPDLADLPLSAVANIEGLVVRVHQGTKAIDAKVFRDVELAGKALLVHTDWAKLWRTEQYFNDHPFLTREAAEYLVKSKVALVGIDSFNIDSTADGTRPAHTLLLHAGIPIVEHLCNLDQLPDRGFRFFAVPVKVKGMGSFPIRAFAIPG